MGGILTVVCGPMFAGKSTALLDGVEAARAAGRSSLVLKPAFDTRYAPDEVVSHDGRRASAVSVEVWPLVPPEVGTVFIDEAQFFVPPLVECDAPAEVAALLARGVDVTVVGLDLDWRGVPFPVVAALIDMADKIVRRAAICAVCGAPATHTRKLTPTGDVVSLGTSESYEARCHACWQASDR